MGGMFNGAGAASAGAGGLGGDAWLLTPGMANQGTAQAGASALAGAAQPAGGMWQNGQATKMLGMAAGLANAANPNSAGGRIAGMGAQYAWNATAQKDYNTQLESSRAFLRELLQGMQGGDVGGANLTAQQMMLPTLPGSQTVGGGSVNIPQAQWQLPSLPVAQQPAQQVASAVVQPQIMRPDDPWNWRGASIPGVGRPMFGG